MVKKETTESRILSAARLEFIEHGLRGARMQSIADRCGVNKALLHYYFRSKERLYQAVLRDIVNTMRTAVEMELARVDSVDDVRTLLCNLVTVYIRTLQNNPDFPRFMLREMADGGQNLPDLVESVISVVKNIPERLHRMLSAGMASGRIRPIPQLHLMMNIIGMCIVTFLAKPLLVEIDRQMRFGLRFDDSFYKTRIETIVEMAMHGITGERVKGRGRK